MKYSQRGEAEDKDVNQQTIKLDAWFSNYSSDSNTFDHRFTERLSGDGGGSRSRCSTASLYRMLWFDFSSCGGLLRYRFDKSEFTEGTLHVQVEMMVLTRVSTSTHHHSHLFLKFDRDRKLIWVLMRQMGWNRWSRLMLGLIDLICLDHHSI